MINDLIYNLLCLLGLEVDNHGRIIDQDTKAIINFNGKVIRYSYGGPFPINSNEDVWFDPINNSEMASKLFNKYKVLLSELEGMRVVKEIEVNDQTTPTKSLVIYYAQNEEKLMIQTQYYRNFSLAYLEVILTLGGISFDLKSLDI